MTADYIDDFICPKCGKTLNDDKDVDMYGCTCGYRSDVSEF